MAVDGDRRAQLLMGVPLMMEYDGPTGAWKLVVDTELDTLIMISGTVSIEAGDLEIGAVEIKDATTDQRAIVNELGQLHVFITGSALGAVDTELPAAVLLSDALANPTAPAVGSYLLVFDEGDTWVRARAGWPAQDGTNPNEVDPAVAVASYLQAYDGTGSYNRLLHDPGRNLRVTLVSGAFPPNASVDTELPAAIPVTNGMANPTAPQVLAHAMFYDEDGDTWDRAYNDAGRNLRVTLISGAFPAGATLPVSLASLPDLVATEDEVTAYVTGTVHAIIDAGDIEIGAVEIKDAVTDDRQRVTADGRAWVNALITGSVGPLEVDPGSNLFTTLISGSFPAGETLPVSLTSLPNLSAIEDEVTAYVTGSVGLVFAPTIQRDIIDITGSAAAEYMLASGVAGQQIKLMEVMLISSNLQNVRFLSGWSGTALTGPLHLANSGDGFFVGTPDGKDVYHFETLSGQMLILDTDAGGQIGGWLNYYIEE